MDPFNHILILTGLLFPAVTFAMPDWDGIYLCSTKAMRQRFIGLKTADNTLHLIGMGSEIEGIDDGLDCINERHDPKPGANAGLSVEISCSEDSLSQALTIFVGAKKSTLKLSVTKTSAKTVDISVGKYQELDNFKNGQEVVFHCFKD